MTYQGELNVSGNPANGHFEFQLELFDAESAGNSVSGTVSTSAAAVVGRFTVELDSGSDPFNEESRRLEPRVRQGGGSHTASHDIGKTWNSHLKLIRILRYLLRVYGRIRLRSK